MLTDPNARQVEELLGREDFTWYCDGAAWWWTLQVGPRVSLVDLHRRICEVIRLCEAQGITHPSLQVYSQLPPATRPIVRKLDLWGVSLMGHPDVTHVPGQIMVTPQGKGGAAVGDLSGAVDWLNGELDEARTSRKVRKLATSGLERGELFLIVDDTGASFSSFYALAFGDGLPNGDPQAPSHLDSIWLAPRWSQSVLRWHRGKGWSRHFPHDN